ncbi:MAG: hypothetical protein Q8Q46_01125 [Candidatus Giovannonibacteria bacterium]|nr:hypothetical protein [Candidatus Giovannonibacteria bacterium]
MKKLLFLAFLFGFWYLAWNAPRSFGPKLLEAQGVGLRCDTPHCNYQRFDRGGHWVGDGRHDPSPYGYGGYAPDTLFGQGGINILNPGPGTTLHVKKSSGGVLCFVPLLNLLCSDETIDFSTAPAAGQQTQAGPQAQSAPQAYTPPAPPVKEETLP